MVEVSGVLITCGAFGFEPAALRRQRPRSNCVGCAIYFFVTAWSFRLVVASRLEGKAVSEGPPTTVRLAVEQYITERDARDSKRARRPTRSDAGQRLRRHVLGESSRGQKPPTAALANIALHKLS